MSELFSQLGINWKLFVAQTVNFLIVLIVLRFTVYKPFLELLSKRRAKIKKGLEDAELARKELLESEKIKAQKIAEGEKKSLEILLIAQKKAEILEADLLKKAREKEIEIIKNAELIGKETALKEKNKFYEEAKMIVKTAIAKTVELSPEIIDEKLIGQVLSKLRK